MAGRRLIAALISAATALSVMTACDPPPPRLAILVNSDGTGDDDSPGDGVCASAASNGACTLTAAISEANASPTGADIELPPLENDPVLPPFEYSGPDLTVTGDVRVIGGYGTRLGNVHITVAAGARLSVSRIRPTEYTSHPVSFRVEGTLVLDQAFVEHNEFLSGADPRPVLEVTATGTAVLHESILVSDHSTAAVVNSGVLVAVWSSVAPIQICPTDQPGCFGTDVAVHTAGDGRTDLSGTATHTVGPWQTSLARCTGTPPVSHGYVHLEQPCGGTPAAGDSNGAAGVSYDFSTHDLTLSTGSPLIDAVPLSEPLCADATVDVFGVTRGLDGDADGIGACEIGARER